MLDILLLVWILMENKNFSFKNNLFVKLSGNDLF